jgi:hypothetical protein
MKRLILIVIVAVLVLAIAGFVLVGRYAARPESGSFDWELASIFGTAVGTTLLALSTGFLAWTTSRDVTATEKIAQATVDEQRARNRPIVVANVDAVGARDITVVLRNVGVGPALALQISAICESADLTSATLPFLSPNETNTVILSIINPRPPLGTTDDRSLPWRQRQNYRVTGRFYDVAREDHDIYDSNVWGIADLHV